LPLFRTGPEYNVEVILVLLHYFRQVRDSGLLLSEDLQTKNDEG
jgi:hypothetical protein